jgi:hypothetical protein
MARRNNLNMLCATTAAALFICFCDAGPARGDFGRNGTNITCDADNRATTAETCQNDLKYLSAVLARLLIRLDRDAGSENDAAFRAQRLGFEKKFLDAEQLLQTLRVKNANAPPPPDAHLPDAAPTAH